MSASPLALLGRSGRGALALLGVVAAAKAVALVLIAEAVATGIASVVAGDDGWRDALVVGAIGAVLRGAAVWAARYTAQRASLAAKTDLRRALAEHALRGGGEERIGATAVLGTRGLDDLDAYFVTFLPALVTAVVVPLVVGARILLADPVSAVIIVLTIPLVPVFMILIGRHTRDAAEAAADALLRLSSHLVELARGLPVLVGLGRARGQAAALDELSDEYRRRTMRTLRTAFLSSFALELIATISVAIVAVVVGLRLVYGDMTLEIGLLVLILAPECFTPFREAGSAYHSSEDGVIALRRVAAATATPAPRPLWADEQVVDFARPLRVKGVCLRYPGRSATLHDVWFTVRPGEATLLDGESGSGKTTLLRLIAGRLGDVAGAAASPEFPEVSGLIEGVPREGIAWVSQHPRVWAATIRDEIRAHAATADDASIGDVLAELDLAGVADVPVHTLSPGQLRRSAVARALARVDAGARLLLLDEPTAHLDERNAERVRSAIARRIPHATTLIASHDPRTQALCAHRTRIGIPSRRTPRSGRGPDAQAPTGIRDIPAGLDAVALQPEPDSGVRPGAGSGLARVWALLRVQPGVFAVALLLGVLAAAFGIAQTALSGWLIVRAAEQPPIMLLTVAIVGVRFFGIGRSVLRYTERLQLHNAVFRISGRLRRGLWAALGGAGLRLGALRRGPAALDLLVGDVDRVRDQLPRVVLPPLVAVVAHVGLLVAAGFFLPAAVAPLMALAVVVLVVAPGVALLADRNATRAEQELRAGVGRQFAGLLEAGDDLAVHAATDGPLRMLDDGEHAAAGRARRSAAAQGVGHALVVGASVVASLWIIAAVAGMPGADGGVLAVFALATLALAEPATEAITAVQRWPALRRVLDRVGGVLDLTRSASPTTERPSEPVASSRAVLDVRGVSARWPGAPAPVFRDIDVRVEAGQWLSVTGPSGSGKSTMLALMMGHLPPETGDVRAAGEIVSPERTGIVAWCPQDAHLFDSSLRANLVLARRPDQRPDDGELRDTLHRVGLGPWLDTLRDGLDTRIGASGGHLSGGQRQRVAVARTLLTGAPVLLLDEPTAHLDEESAESLLAELRSALATRAVVCVTHDPRALRAGDLRLDLGIAEEPRESAAAMRGVLR